ncbi:MAG: HAD family hydrolase [Promicromonosporaceae bacterium]|nr:HAD family hydrolase [Promicromonosporaceae bacterium]
MGSSQVKCVVFDVGETLIDESRLWLRWAGRLRVTPHTLLGLIGACAQRGLNVEAALQLAVPGLDVRAEEAAWERDDPDGLRGSFDAEDLYPDVFPALTALRVAGYRIVIAGNQPAAALARLQAMNLPVDAMQNSAELGFEKPDPGFFAAVAALAGVAPAEIAYVGDRLDNDVLPALAAGMRPVLIRRGPYGYLHATRPELAETRTPVIDSLLELPTLVSRAIGPNMTQAPALAGGGLS